MNEKRPSARPISKNVELMKEELASLQKEVANDAAQFEGKSKSQGCLGFAIMVGCTVIGAILGFGVLSIFTGIGGWLIGVQIAGSLVQDSPEQGAYEAKKKRIKELELTLSQLSR